MFRDRCDGHIIHKVIKQGQASSYDLDGVKHSVPVETPTTEETTITCTGCPLAEIVFQSEGIGFAAYNAAARRSNDELIAHCQKWQQKVACGEQIGRMPDSFLPQK